ncbi:permease component of ribose/xylose/arabinose/galactoside ABC-type transporters [Hoeflea sp. IMCC20628]|uniref:ABC transporter permease n=1 Tax=Hoeflea sp. IMCC20628 TaxID=1620421 RepID=UPI00063AE1FE|nr:ABC transporter permease [Hoeflea sp. IMCC20628]AKH99242.1 permease component of ribose/xylose/arabinose/galactoside ABC-type transporters [Hoeflea sp. IMCC20628]
MMQTVTTAFKRNRLYGALLMVVILHLTGIALIDGYGSIFTLRSMLVLSALLAVASVGQTLVIILGGIDLSIPFVVGVANVVAAQLYGDGMDFALVFVIVSLLALGIGALNGLISAGLGVHPLIVTLGVGTVALGAVQQWTGGFPSGSAPQFISDFVSIGGTLGPLPFPGLVPAVFVLIALVVLVLRRTTFGRQLYALGSNPSAARYALIRPVFTWTVTFAISGFFAALAGILLLGFSGSAYAGVGEPYLFQTIAAVVIGGTALVGGSGSYVGTAIGAAVLIEVNTLLIGLGFNPSAVQAGLGLGILVLVSLYGRERTVAQDI